MPGEPMCVTIVITDDRYTADFAGDCAGVWGRYEGGRRFVNEWLRRPRSELEARWAAVHGIDGVTHGNIPASELDDSDRAMWRWIVEECPLIALAVMCAEWEGAS